jgi:hypothetical protein
MNRHCSEIATRGWEQRPELPRPNPRSTCPTIVRYRSQFQEYTGLDCKRTEAASKACLLSIFTKWNSPLSSAPIMLISINSGTRPFKQSNCTEGFFYYLEFVYKVQLLRCCSKFKSSNTLVFCGLNFSHALNLNFLEQTLDIVDRYYLTFVAQI